MKVIFKKDTKGNMRYIKCWSEGALLFKESGIVGTDSPVVHEEIVKGKNQGKINETTAVEQAFLEVERFFSSKLKGGYSTTIEGANTSSLVYPMLAKEYKKESHKVDWSKGVIVNPKLDGMRCLATIKNGEVTLMSRKGDLILNLSHITNELKVLPDCILDGELYVDGENFQTNMRYIKKYREGLTERISFWIYDMVSEKPYIDRISDAEKLIEGLTTVSKTPREILFSENEMFQKFGEYIGLGYEGLMVKICDGKYKSGGRSSDLLKYKEFMDIQLPIIDIVPSNKRPTWGKPFFGNFHANVKMTIEEKEDLLINKEKYIGRVAEIRFFEYSEEGIPRHPVMYGFRLDK